MQKTETKQGACLYFALPMRPKIENQVYCPTPQRELLLDIYYPDPERDAGPEAIPLVIWIHGGAWMRGDKTQGAKPASWLTRRGIAVAAIQYRLSGEAIFPAPLHDCKAAVRWLRAQAGELGLDPLRFGAWGESAGGHLAALLGTSAGVGTRRFGVAELDLDGGDPGESADAAVQAVCDWYGPTDFLLMNDMPGHIDHNAPDSPESRLLGAPIRTCPDLCALADPATYASAASPAFLIVHGTMDRTVPPNQAEHLHAALTRRGASSRLRWVEGAGHGFFSDEAVWEEAAGFFAENFTLK